MGVLDLWNVTLKGYTPSGESNDVVLEYEAQLSMGFPDDGTMVATRVWDWLKAEIRNTRSTLCGTSLVVAYRPFNPVDGFGTYVVPLLEQPGLVGGEPMPSFVTFSFIKRRTTNTVKNGRIGLGVPAESDISAGAVLPAAVTRMSAFASKVGSSITAIQGDPPVAAAILRPVIVSRTVGGGQVRPTPLFDYVKAVTYSRVGSQNSRKPGRGK